MTMTAKSKAKEPDTVELELPPLEINAGLYYWYAEVTHGHTNKTHTLQDEINDILSGSLESWIENLQQDPIELIRQLREVEAEAKQKSYH